MLLRKFSHQQGLKGLTQARRLDRNADGQAMGPGQMEMAPGLRQGLRQLLASAFWATEITSRAQGLRQSLDLTAMRLADSRSRKACRLAAAQTR